MKNLIAFRPDKDLEKSFSTKLALLGVSESEFARRSVRLGMDRAFEELAAEQRKEAQALIARLKLPTTAAALAFVAPLTPLMALVSSERDNGKSVGNSGPGVVAQLVEREHGMLEVAGSIPVGSRPELRLGTGNGDDALPGLPGSIGIQASAGRLLRRKQSCPN